MSDTHDLSPAKEQVAAELKRTINLEGNARELSVTGA
jgi:hypothetical protein